MARTDEERLYEARREYQRSFHEQPGTNDLHSLETRLESATKALESSRQMYREHLWRKQALEEQIIIAKMRAEEDEASLNAIEELLYRVEHYISKAIVWPGVHQAAEKVRALLNTPDTPYRRKGK